VNHATLAGPQRRHEAAPLPMHRRPDVAEVQADRAAHEAMAGSVRTPLSPAQPQAGGAQARALPRSGGLALDAPLRRDMEARFGHSFAQVRVHADVGAARTAATLGAQAWAQGPHIGFGAGRYAPASSAGRELIAHELAHVVQQGRPGAAQRPMCKPEGPAKVEAKPATPEDKREFASEALKFLKEQGEFFAQLPKLRDPATTLPHLRTTVENALKAIDGDTSDAGFKLAADLRATYTEAVRTLLTASTKPAPGSTTTPPTLPELYERHRADILPFAHPVDSGRAELSDELEAPLPASPSAAQRTRHAALGRARQRLKVSTATIDMGYADLFKPGASGATLPTGMTVRFSSTIPAVLQPGLQRVVARMGAGILEPDSTLMLALDLRAFGGGNDAYRFTRLDLAGGRTPQIEVWVERQGAILSEAVGTEERKAMRERFDRVGFKRDSSFSDTAEFDQVLIGVGEVPENHLAGLTGLNFKREGAHATSPTTSAEYQMAPHEVVVFDRAYASSIARQGRAGRVIKGAAYVVAHELGHAADWRSLRAGSQANRAAEDALIAEFGTGGRNWGFGRDATQDQRTRYRTLDSARATARSAQMAARSRSGARWVDRGGTTQVTHDRARGAPTPAFEAAARLDDGPGSPRMPTNYPNVEPDHLLDEYYAECFALYQTNPDLLRRIRPNVFKFFQTDLPT
jgi:hypothetical protein